MIGRTRREIGAQTPTAHSDVFARSQSNLLGSRDLGCPRMEEVLRAPAAHGVSSLLTLKLSEKFLDFDDNLEKSSLFLLISQLSYLFRDFGAQIRKKK